MLSYRRARGASQSVWATVAPSYRPDKDLGATSTTSAPRNEKTWAPKKRAPSGKKFETGDSFSHIRGEIKWGVIVLHLNPPDVT
ncbi:MAG: hypothetical protein ACI8PT_003733 [Gammaproteobacteria bacterium]|jgi:hypothetical protein